MFVDSDCENLDFLFSDVCFYEMCNNVCASLSVRMEGKFPFSAHVCTFYFVIFVFASTVDTEHQEHLDHVKDVPKMSNSVFTDSGVVLLYSYQ